MKVVKSIIILISTVTLNGCTLSYNTGYKVKFDVGKEDVTDIPQTQTVKKGMYAEEPAEPSKEESIFLGWYSDKECTKYFDFENTPIEKDITLYAEWFDFASKTDTDGNGINDGDEDFDGDGLTNKEEISQGTARLVSDTDEDGLSDYEEVVTYHTDPLNADTDKDGLTDKSEIRLGTDPNKEDTDGNGIKDGDEYYKQVILEENYQKDIFSDNAAIPTSTINAKGDVNNTVYVEEYTGHLKGEEREYVGKLLEVKNSDMKSGEISFSLGKDYKIKSYEYESVSTNGLIICYNT